MNRMDAMLRVLGAIALAVFGSSIAIGTATHAAFIFA
jgi:hypothetical protein